MLQPAVAEVGLTMTQDPFADEVLFIRSDQDPFIRDGVQRFREFLATRYHMPSDDLDQPIDWPGAAKLALLNFRIELAIGNDPQRPAWNPGEFFGRQSGG
jgi:hypothetical protein